MEMGVLTEDQLDELIAGGERQIATVRMVQMAAIREKQRRRSHLEDGYRSIVDWVAARADVSHQTARSLCWTATRLGEAPEVAASLATGEITFDRAEQLVRLPVEQRTAHEGHDIAQLRRRVAHYRRLTRRRERKVLNGYLHLVPFSEDMSTSLWGELPGFDARIVEQAVDQRVDDIFDSTFGLGVAERRAIALVAICQDALYDIDPDQETSSPVEVSVSVDARTAASSKGETGVAVLAGPRIGPRSLEEVFCNGIVEVVGITESGEPLNLGRRTRIVRRKLRRFVLERDGGCTAEGCPSRYRLEAHHVVPWSQGGSTDAEDLVTLCWFHHHVAVHRLGCRVVRLGVSRVRLERPPGGPSPPRRRL
jgi:hypothetical protein